MSHVQPSPLLRNALLADGLLGISTGLLLVLGANWLAGFLELPRLLLMASALILLPLGGLLFWLSRQSQLHRQAVWAVISLNTLWVIESGLSLLLGWIEPNLFGYVFIIGQAVVVALLAELQWFGLRQSRALAV
ncbi:hypothetical protein DFO61_3568 [Ectopseudomonas oleovorans]|uniref:Uncharacterized protein n=2 Tax=Pseudomonadaceae TaxID=135621 RepID=A0A397MB06_ECTOL|nr:MULTISPECIES: hypothetical protein [Pseudomonas]QMV63153.1 hypothetical protein HS968_24565 [Pseudomonas berkeleyensis]RIA21148.1 hypothetical protein DFO61_3568 [Pseudomonas oleovorans]WSO38609.1 hypothetical protein VUJ49_24665 [Pseudomonas berkeleyensis]